jgi:lipoprotein-anchoring transpeptidase ErfK/SrfK
MSRRRVVRPGDRRCRVHEQGLRRLERTAAVTHRQRAPILSRAVPFTYGRVNTRSALRYLAIPSVAEERRYRQAVASGRSLPSSVKRLDGDYFVAIDREERGADAAYYRTVRGRYIRKDQVDLRPEPAMRGVLITGDVQLPLGFVWTAVSRQARPPPPPAPAPLLERSQRRAEPPNSVDVVPHHANFRVRARAPWAGREVVVTTDGFGVPRERVRIAARISRPRGIGARDKWVHVDLREQVLVAYHGDTPIFATLVSSGRDDGYATPTGLFRIDEKHVTATMRGEDPIDGPYEVGDVPWTMYYSGSYALHGAYWHDSFGQKRSHGCINLSPIDARWLFAWSDGEVPVGFHARRHVAGSRVYITDS